VKNEIVILTKTQEVLDKDGYKNGVKVVDEREVFAEEKSVTREEFFKALQSGFSADIVLCVNRDEYDGHNKAYYNGNTYRIYRTYSSGVYDIELMCERVEDNGTA